MPAPMSKDNLYLLSDTTYPKPSPSGTQNLTKLFGLSDLAASVARFDPETNQKRKLRKSYKNQISDLPGKHSIPQGSTNSSDSILQLARQPPRIDPNQAPPPLQPALDQDLLSRALSLDRTPATGIPDFDVSLLATPSYPMSSSAAASPASGGGGGSNGVEKKKKRKEEYTDSLNPKRFKK